MLINKTRGNRHKLTSRKFHLRTRKNFCPLRMAEHWNGLRREAGESLSLETFETHPDAILCKAALAGVWRNRDPFQPWPFCGPVIDWSIVKTVETHSCRKVKAAGAVGSDSLTKANLNGKFCSICCPTALLPQVPTPELPRLGGRLNPALLLHPDLGLHLLSVPGCKLPGFAAGLAAAPRAGISQIRWGGQLSAFGSPALPSFSSCIDTTCLSDR